MRKMTISDGASRKKPPAKRKFSGAPSSSASTCAGSVRWRSVRSEAAKTSFQETMKTKIADAASPGSASGSATFTKRRQPAAAERHRRLLELVRDAGEDARRHEHRERQRERRVRDRDAEHGVVDAPADEGDGERNREDDDRERARAHDREPEACPPPRNAKRASA